MMMYAVEKRERESEKGWESLREVEKEAERGSAERYIKCELQ